MSHDACETGHPTPTPAVKVTTTHTGYFLGGDYESSALTAIPYDADPLAYYDNSLSLVSLLPEEARRRDDGTAPRGRFEITVRFYPSHHQGEACANGARRGRCYGSRHSDPTCPPGEPCQVHAGEVRP